MSEARVSMAQASVARMSAAEVRARMASLMLAPRAAVPARVGGFTLRPTQEQTLDAVLRAVREFGGALLADPPGTGKTVLAIAAAHALGASSILVIAPAPLRSQWSDSAARGGVAIAFASFESLSRGAKPPRARLVIVDEAHNARTPATRRYARLAECCVDARVLLLTATPVVNRAADRDALLALFVGARSTALSAEEIARCVVRREAADPLKAAQVCDESDVGRAARRPTVGALGVIGRGVDVPGLASAIAALPPPLPLVDGRHASALIAMSLAMAWRSSLAALDSALRRRIQRGAAMRDLLRDGHTPSHAMLRHWVLHDDATQLAMGALLEPVAHRGTEDSSEALATLDVHVHAVASLRQLIRPHRAADAMRRAHAIRALAQEHPRRRIVVFARHAETVRSLYTALRSEPGVVAIIGSRVLAAAGRWTRDEVLRAIGPRADTRTIRILLATDVVAEGVEMQGVSIVVHADLPWTPARLEQRIGRVTRVGSPHREALEARFGAPPGARALIRLGARLRRKSEARDHALRAARAQARITAVLEAWRAPERADGEVVAIIRANRDAFVAVVGDPPRWLVGECRDGRWLISSAPRRVARALRAAGGEEAEPSGEMIRDHERRIARALERRAARALASPSASATRAPDAAAEPAIIRRRVTRVRARLARILARAPALARAEIAARQSAVLERLSRPLEVAREHRLDALLRADLDDASFARRLGALLHDEKPGADETDRSHEPHHNDKSRPSSLGRLRCLLILSRASGLPRAPAPAPPSASPGTAVPR